MICIDRMPWGRLAKSSVVHKRKVIEAGMEEVAEDPRRRDLYRLWMARNCNFLNNFVPLIMLAMLSNMDVQATLSKDAVIEYMAKYMTKSGQGSLIQVMEHSFALCIEKARELQLSGRVEDAQAEVSWS